jgi:hypothetical protein
MERVLIVAKTRMSNDACVGGLALDTNRNVRLLRPGGLHQPENTSFDVGQVWELDSHQPSHLTPPHIEDVIVTKEHYVGQQPDLRNFLMQRIQPWRGGLDKLFDGLLVIEGASGYVSRYKGIPKCSVGYWLPDTSLTMTFKNNKPSYQLEYRSRENSSPHRRSFSIKYVGFSNPIYRIPAGSLIRVSLARWWVQPETDEERCYLQLSGWYL